MTLPKELEDLARFHGHLGPYVVIGYRMGKIARRELPGKLWAICFSGPKPPLSCMIDGVQFTSCCTLGKGNISIRDEGVAKARFHDQERILDIELKEEVMARVEQEMSRDTEERLSLELFGMDDHELFRISSGESPKEERLVKLK